MSLETEIYGRLSGYAGLSSLVGDRIYPVQAPQNVTLPAVVYQRISTLRASAFGDDTGDARARVQVDIYAKKLTSTGEALDVKEQVRNALQRYSNTVLSDIQVEDERQDIDSDTNIYRVSIDFMVWYKE